ncbi:MAG: hypothetical protein WCD76_12120 [Pyrinomonadaceae bacterium]
MEVSPYPVRPAKQMFYSVAGRSLCVDTPGDWSSRLFEQFFAGWYLSAHTAESTCRADATIKVYEDGDIPPVPHGLESFEVAAGGRCDTDGSTYYLQADDSLVVVHPERNNLVEVWIGHSADARSQAPLARLVFNASMAALRRCHLYELHGGGVAEPVNKKGVLFIGPSGSGKSTLTTQLAAGGWWYLSDDSLLLSDSGNAVEARGLRRAFAVTETTMSATGLGELSRITTAPVPFDPFKRRFEPHAVFPAGYLEACQPGALFFPSITTEPTSRVRSLSTHEAMARLLRMCPWACYDKPSAREHLRVLGDLSKQCVAYELFSGRDLLGNPEFTSNFILSHLTDRAL